MTDISKHFDFEFALVDISHFYIYLLLAGIIAFILVVQSSSNNKIEMFFISFYLLSGNLNDILTFKIPGIGFFELQPNRIIYLLLLFFLARKSIRKSHLSINRGSFFSLYQLALFGYVGFLILSIVVNVFPSGIKTIVDAVAFIIIVQAITQLKDKASYDLIKKSMIIGAVFSSLISILQLVWNPYFLRIGDPRAAFGPFLRSNGLFSTEYYNSYFLIIATGWVLVSIKNPRLRTFLVILFSIGVICSFQRMSWIVLSLILLIYYVVLKRTAIQRIILAGLTFLTLITSITLLFYQDIRKSSIVQERLTDSVDGRKGYYTMVLETFGQKPVLGFGDLNNDVYYENMLRITNSRERAEATRGGIHNGYLSNLFRYGLPAAIFFMLFVILVVYYYSKAARYHNYFIVPLVAGIVFMIGNLTNTFIFLSHLSVIFALHLGYGQGLRRLVMESQTPSLGTNQLSSASHEK